MTFDWTHGPLAEGLRHYNAGEFFAAHESWESVWLTTPPPEKTFLQGLIQVTVAFHHLQRGNTLGATRLLTAALRKLEPHAPSFCGISTTPLCDDIRTHLHALAADPSTTPLPPPRIHPL
jgi:predicted metal-dependent hydrolase